MDLAQNSLTTDPTAPLDAPIAANDDKPDDPARVLAHVAKIIHTIKSDREFHKKVIGPNGQMRADMFMAMKGRDKDWSEKNYKANFAGRHVKTKTAALYAKNPTAVAKCAERLDFAIWDENTQSLMLAFQALQAGVAAQQQAAAQPPSITAMGQPVPAQPQLPPGFQEAQALIQDFQQGMAYRKQMDAVGKTLEILFARALRDQEPLTFKEAAKQLVRRACTCGVGYVELGFIRQYGPRDDLTSQLADAKVRLDHLRHLSEEAVEGEITEEMAEAAELEASIAALTAEPDIILREGLTFDFPASTKVIPDQLCKSLTGFVGARHLAIEYDFTVDEVEELFPGCDIKSGYSGYGTNGSLLDDPSQASLDFDDEDGESHDLIDAKGKGLVRVWKYYDKPSGLVYYVADGHKSFLRPPAPPDVFVEKFWPVFALTFNAVESEDELYPPSDVYLLRDGQNEHNRSRQGMREHRDAARPRWGTTAGMLDDEGTEALKHAKPFDVIKLNKDPQTKLSDVLEPIPVPGVDPNLYATEQYDQDRGGVVGASESTYGGVAKGTATESAIAASSVTSSDGSSSDDLDSFLTVVSRAGSQILLKEMSEEQVKKIVGPGAMWPTLSLQDIAGEVFLEVEAGSSGRPNQAVEVDAFTKMAPIIMQIPGIDHVEFAREALRILNSKIDLTKMLTSGVPSIIAMNQAKQPATGNAASDPNQQGPKGGQNAIAPPQQVSPGTGPAFGGNQT
jgi:hypothetical protein